MKKVFDYQREKQEAYKRLRASLRRWLELTDGDIGGLAKFLGVDQRTIARWLAKLPTACPNTELSKAIIDTIDGTIHAGYTGPGYQS